MELKYKQNGYTFYPKMRSNCTFMELKFQLAGTKADGAAGSNCTFMELKFLLGSSVSVCRCVLIVPLWN